MTIRRIGVLTGGGDVPGLNACIKTVTLHAVERGWDVVGIRGGYHGLLHFDPQDPSGSAAHLMELSPNAVRTIDRAGGTILHTTRLSPDRLVASDLPAFLTGAFSPDQDGRFDCTAHILRVLETLRIDALVALGGDGTLNYAARLQREGVPIMLVPKTMDNDVFGTDYCIGFSTAVTRSVEFVNALRTTAGSHERIAVIELFGRNSGETALVTGHLAGADRVLIAEFPFDISSVCSLLAQDRAANPANYAMAIVSEGARMTSESRPEQIGNVRELGGIGAVVGAEIRRRTGVATITQNLGYLMRSGTPDALDLMVAKSYGSLAVQLLAQGRHGLMMSVRDGKYAAVAAETCTLNKRRVDIDALYDRGEYRPRISGILGMPMFLC
jgi:ATP-dependent phosphofructokinase / diphosphate-dependent phosphofructokinase